MVVNSIRLIKQAVMSFLSPLALGQCSSRGLGIIHLQVGLPGDPDAGAKAMLTSLYFKGASLLCGSTILGDLYSQHYETVYRSSAGYG